MWSGNTPTHHSITPWSGYQFHRSSDFRQGLGSDIFHERIEVFLDLGDAEDFLDGGDAGLDFVPAINAQRAHALFDGPRGDGRGSGASQDQRPQRLVQHQQFVNGQPPLVAKLAAILATHAAHESRAVNVLLGKTYPAQIVALD